MQSVQGVRPRLAIGFFIMGGIAVLAIHQIDITHLQTMIFGSQNKQNSPQHDSKQQDDSNVDKNFPKESRNRRAVDSPVMENLDIQADSGSTKESQDSVKLRNLDALVSRLLVAQKELRKMLSLTQVKMGEPSRTKRAIDDEKIRTEINETHQGHTYLKSSLGGAIYVRWGRTTCPNESTELVYNGVAAGSHYEHDGAAANTLCLPHDPVWNKYGVHVYNYSTIFGAEYKYLHTDLFSMKNAENLENHNMPCSVCRSHSRNSAFMLPARKNCYDGWHLEYHGYLMAGYYVHKAASEFICVDEAPEADPAGYRDEKGRWFNPVEAVCGSLPCPPYVSGRELACAVCSK